RGGGRRVLLRAHRARPAALPHHDHRARVLEVLAHATRPARRSADMNPLYRARKQQNRVLLFISCLALAFGLFWLVWILGVLFYEGGAALLRASLYYQMTPPPGSDGGLANAIAGSALLVAMATLIGTPIGILAGTYLAARTGILAGIPLAVARISGETARLLFTALNKQFWSMDLNRPMSNLPAVIFQFAMSPYEDWHRLAWGGAALITLAVLALNIVARLLFRKRT